MEMIQKFRVVSSVAWQQEKTNGYIYVYDQKTKSYFLLEGTGKDIWLGIVKGMTLQELLEKISYKYNVGKDIVIDDIHELINAMLLKGLITNLF